MNDQIQITLTQQDAEGHLIPFENLIKDNFKFRDFTGGITGPEINFLTFYDRGGGSYIFGDFQISEVTPSLLHLNDIPILSLGILYLGSPELSFIKKSGDTLTGVLNADGNRITGLPTNQDDNTAPSDAASVGLIMGVNSYISNNYVNKSGDTLTGILNADGNRITGLPTNQDDNTAPSDAASVGLIMGVNSYISHNYLNFPNNFLIVDSSLSANILGKKYKSIQDAISYAMTKTPGYSNQFNILIYPGKTSDGYLENITLQPFIHLTGIFGKPIITGNISGSNSNVRITNLSFTYPGNLSLNQLRAFNCSFRVTNNDTGYILTITNCILNSCSLINLGQAEFSPTIVSAGGNIFLNCLSNIPCPFISTDKGSILSIDSVTTDFS